MIEIKLLKNKHYNIKNEEALIVEGEHNATTVKVEFPEETAVLSKRVDFKSYEGKKLSDGLYTPEICTYDNGFDKLCFEFTIPNEMTHTGELKMQFVAYQPEMGCSERMVIYYQTIVLWISEGIARLRQCGEFDDLITEMAKFCVTADESAKEAWDAATNSINISNAANEKSDEALDTANRALANSEQADRQSLEAIDISKRAEEVSQASNESSEAALLTSQKAEEQSSEAVITANNSNEQSLQAVAIAETAERNSVSAESKSDKAIADSAEAISIANAATETANTANAQSLEAISIAENAEAISQSAESKSDVAVANSEDAVAKSESAVSTAEQANQQSIDAVETAQRAEANSVSAEEKSDRAVADAENAVLTSTEAKEISERADLQSLEAISIAQNAESISQTADSKSDTAIANSEEAITKSESAVAISEQSERQSADAVETAQRAEANSISAEAKADSAVADSSDALTKSEEAVSTANTAASQCSDALDVSEQARTIASSADVKADEALSKAEQALIESAEAVETAERADAQSLDAVETSMRAESNSIIAEQKASDTLANSVDAVNTANEAMETARTAEQNSINALSTIDNANDTAQAADEKATLALSTANDARDVSLSAKAVAEQAKTVSADADNLSNQALNLSNTAFTLAKTADTKAEIAIIDSATALSKSAQALHYTEQAMSELSQANFNALEAKNAAAESKTLAIEARLAAESVIFTANHALSKAGDAEVIASDAKVSAGAARIAADLAAEAAEQAKESALNSEAIARGLDEQIQSANDTAGNAEIISQAAMDKASEAMQKAEDAEAAVASKQDALGFIPEDLANKNQANGYAGLDENGKVPLEQINDALLGNVSYQGLWDAASNVPDLTEVSPKGHYYVATSGGNRFGIKFEVGDWIISNGTAWGRVYNTDAVSSVAGKTGNIVLVKSDVGLGNVDNTSDASKPISTATQTALNNKVDKVSGKGLSTEDYTSAEKTKLAGIANNANNYVHPSSHAPSIITQDSSNRFVTDAQISAWGNKAEKTAATTTADGLMSAADKVKLNGITAGAAVTGVKGDSESTYRTGNVNITKANIGLGNVDNTTDAAKPVSTATQTALNNKVDKVSGKGLSTEDYTSAEKTKLSGIETGANKYTHPSTHPASIITQDSSNRFVSDTEKSAWNGKAEKTAASQSVAGLMSATDKTKLDGIAAGAQVNTVTSVAGKTGAVTLAKGDVGLGNVDNTSDASKPISTATQTALNNKVDKVSGKQLSTEDYTSAEKTKLSGIEAGAQVNTVTGIKGNSESTYRTGNVNITTSNIGAEPAFSKNTAFNKSFGSSSGTVCEGNDSRLSNARTPTSHATSSTTYGQGDASNYGHVKLSSLEGSSTLVSGDAALKYHYKTAESDINLNNYVYEGRFTLYNVPTSITDSANNFPSGWNTGNQNYNTAYLEVRRFYNSTEIHQTLYKRRTTQRWVRVLMSGSWSVWTEIDMTAANAVPNTRTVNGKALSSNITLSGSDIGITANANLGNATTVQAALNYIANVFAGTQQVTKIKATNFDTP